jgi:uncharacterized protein YqiB (DUF1249 family)
VCYIEFMQTDQLCVVTWRSRPRSFVSLMTLYESNFIRLGWLALDVQRLPSCAVSHVAGDCELHLAVTDRSRYTTTLSLTYWFNDAGKAIAEPNLELRVYHDARLVEALGSIDGRRHRDLADLRGSGGQELDVRWMRNQMLNKWLEYCAERGHRFAVTPGA